MRCNLVIIREKNLRDNRITNPGEIGVPTAVSKLVFKSDLIKQGIEETEYQAGKQPAEEEVGEVAVITEETCKHLWDKIDIFCFRSWVW